MAGLPGLVALMCTSCFHICRGRMFCVDSYFRQASQVQWRACCRSSDAIILHACRQASKQDLTMAVICM